ncbi:MAG: hypothetical protein H7A36_00150 [Chlamydiales bacterium]|nr:hypothetical protein [Chlamydiales bacterium]
MANPPPTIVGPPPGVASSYTNGTEHLDPVHRAIYDLAQQYFANRTYPNSIGNAPSPWPYGPHPLLSAYPPAAQMGPYPYVVMPGPGLMLQTPFSFPWLPYGMPSFMPGPGQFPSAPPPGHYPPPAPLPAESPAPPPVPLSSASSPQRPAPHAPLLTEDDASLTDSAPLHKPSAGNKKLRRQDLEAAKKMAEDRAIEQAANRDLLFKKAVCKICDPPVQFNSWDLLRTHSQDNHRGKIRCWHSECEMKTNDLSQISFYKHLSVHGCARYVFICGDCITNPQDEERFFSEFRELRQHSSSSHRSPSEEYTRINVKLINRQSSHIECTVTYFFSGDVDEHMCNLLSAGSNLDDLFQIIIDKNKLCYS